MKRVYTHCIQRFSASWSSVLLCSGHAMMFVSCHVRAVPCSRALSCSCHVPRAMVVVPCLCHAIMCMQCHVRALPFSCAVLFLCRAIFVPCYVIAIALGKLAKKTWALLLAKVAVVVRLVRCFSHLVDITMFSCLGLVASFAITIVVVVAIASITIGWRHRSQRRRRFRHLDRIVFAIAAKADGSTGTAAERTAEGSTGSTAKKPKALTIVHVCCT